MSRGRFGGIALCLLAVLLGIAYILGLIVERWRFWAIAIPLSLGVAFVLVLVFWIGYTIATTDTEYPSHPVPEREQRQLPSEPPARSRDLPT